jgi:PAS domain S-box-containing protein
VDQDMTGGLRILVIEDDLVDRKLLERLLSRSPLQIAELKVAGNLKSALTLLEQESFDIVLADLGLPDSQGLEGVTRLREVVPQIPVIVLSGLDDEAVVTDAAHHGVQDYLIKGQVDSSLLNRSISYALERKKGELAIQVAQERYRTIFENSAVAIMMVDEQERLVSWNKFTENLLNLSHEDLYLRPVQSLYPVSEWDNIRAQHLRETGTERHLETQMIRRGGGVIDVDVSLSMIRDAEGKITGSVGVIRDITERKQVEEALRKSEERFRQVVENAEEWIWEVDAHGLYTYISPVVERILGYKADEIQGHKYFHDLFHPQERERLTQKAFEVFSRKDRFREFETKVLDKNGQTVWLSKSGVPILDEQGQLMGYRGVDVDITERRRTHEILNRKQKNLEAIFDAAPIGMLLVGENMRVGRANDAVRNLAGKDYAQIINQLVGQVLGCVYADEAPEPGEMCCGHAPECETCQLFNTVRESLDSGLPVHGVEIQPTLIKNGQEITPAFSVSAEPVIIDGARYAVVALNDITDRARAEKELRETMEMKSQFISTVSHELRTPLASMKEAVLIVLDGVAGDVNDDQRHFLDLAKRNIDRLWRLINDVLDFQKLGSCKMKFNMGKNNLAQIVEECYSTMTHFANKSEVNLSLEKDPSLPESVFDPDRIIQAVTNLISNAIKFTPAHGNVAVCVRQDREELVVRISDTGMGVPKEALPRIFDRFYRVNRPGKEIKGTGLGLAIVKRIVDAHGGRIEVESEPAVGTIFTVFLPVAYTAPPEVMSETTDEILEKAVGKTNTDL